MIRTDLVDDRLIAEANRVLVTLVDGLSFAPMSVAVNNRDPDDRRHKTLIHVRAPYGTFAIRLTTRGDSISIPMRGFGYGGTVQDAIAHLYRFTQGMTRGSRYWWERRVGYSDVLAAIDATSYLDPTKTSCVLCGAGEPTIDWWCDKLRKGPCCTFGKCREGKVPGA